MEGYVEIKGLVFEMIKRDIENVELSSIHRMDLKVSINDEIEIKRIEKPKESDYVVCKVEKVNGNGENERIEEEEIIKKIRQIKGPIAVKRTYITEYNGITYKIKIMDQNNKYGMMGKETEIIVTSDTVKIVAEKKKLLKIDFDVNKMGIGGLNKEMETLFRRAFSLRLLSEETLTKMGVQHIKGIILYGHPGCGKTLIARKIGQILNCEEPIIVNGPELLNKYVGQSEESLRKIFEKAEMEKDKLHLIIFDEIDSMFKVRGTGGSSGVGDSMVNQMLSKMDGVNSLNNIIIIGMTNRLDLIDEALLRPGRFEIQIEIGLPDQRGRHEILKIHTDTMYKNSFIDDNVDLSHLSYLTKDFSGADLAGLVRNSTTYAVDKKKSHTGVLTDENIKLDMSDFLSALSDLKVKMPSPSLTLDPSSFSFIYDNLPSKSLRSLLIKSDINFGKTTLALNLSRPYSTKIIDNLQLLGLSDDSKIRLILKAYYDLISIPSSCLILDNIELLIDYTRIGPRFNNSILQTFLTFLRSKPHNDMLIIVTSSESSLCYNFDLEKHFHYVFDYNHHFPSLSL